MADLPDGWTVKLLTGIAELIDAAGIGVWDPTGAYTDSSVTAISIDAILPAPDRLITLAEYPISTEPGLADVTVGVQVRVRGTKDTRVRRNIADAVCDLLDGLNPRVPVGGIAVVQFERRSYAPLGRDGNDRWQSSHNYYVDAMRPTVNNSD